MRFYKISSVFTLVALVIGMFPHTTFAAAVCDIFTVTPTSALPGDFVTLTWSTTNTIGVTIDVLGSVATSGSALYEVPNTPGLVSLNLEALDSNLSEPNNDFCSADLTILGPAVCNYFTATPDTLDGAGDVTLDWDTTDADIAVTIDNGVGVVSEDGSVVVPVTTDTTFTLTADGTYGSTQCSVPVTVNGLSSGGSSSSGGGKSINPTCQVTVDKPQATVGDTVQVSWQSTNVESLALTKTTTGQTSSILSTTSPSVITSGSFPVVVTSDTTFKLAVARPNRSSECEVAVVVKPNNLNGAIAGDAAGLIALANLPQTGFDPTVGFLIVFNMFLAFGAAMGAYVVVQFSHQYRRANDRSFTGTNLYTPMQAMFSQERRSLHSRVILWKWLAITLLITIIGGFLLWY